MGAFATVEQLEAVLEKKFTDEEKPRVEVLLADASTHLRDVIGAWVAPQQTATVRLLPRHGWIDLPQHPVVSVESVLSPYGVPLDFDFTGDAVKISETVSSLCEVTFTYGATEVPAELARMACVLASTTLLTLEASGALEAGGLATIAIDDFRASWSDGGVSSGMHVPELQAERLRARYGLQGVEVVHPR
ncbi:hypothetical protein M3D15_04585 [Pseudoclavibacter alba]|uniref:Head-to-tail adaptor n=1 Tax=Pseudoclavibacter albus TaxID=272241 RepID=A0ABT2HWB8_9MICO|nr:hypothetical protein [Pseudoclavibacter alba]MCT2042612.1 hypothetical protein [Pseudoclavibacter alba]